MDTAKLVRVIIYSLVSVIFILGTWLVINEFGLRFISAFSARSLQASLLPIDSPAPQIIPAAQKPIRDWSVEDLKITASAAIGVEQDGANSKFLFKLNENQKLPIASLTKLMTAIVAIENYDLSYVTIVDQAAVDQDGKQGFLSAGDILSLEDLLDIMLVESCNDAAYALAEVVGIDNFVGLMNAKAQAIGLAQTNFEDPAGLDQDNYSTADDLVKLSEYISSVHPLIWQVLSLNNFRLLNPQGRLHHVLISTNELLGKIPNIVGGKTGLTHEAKGCLLLLVKNPINQNNMVYIILGSDDRSGEMEKLINWTNQAYIW